MVVQSKKLIKWHGKNYAITILNFVLHYVIISALIIGLILVYSRSVEGFKGFFRNIVDRRGLIFTLTALFYIFLVIYFYFYFEFRDFLLRARNIALLFAIIDVCFIICYLVSRYFLYYSRPMILCALLTLFLINKRSAFFINVIFCIIMFAVDLFVMYPAMELANNAAVDRGPVYISFIVSCATGMLAIHLAEYDFSRISMLYKGLILFPPILLCTLAFEYINLNVVDFVSLALACFASPMLSMFAMTGIIPVYESVFRVLTNYKLSELASDNAKLITKLKNEAPGTYNHCIMVATLAESCASAIGENPLLARTAAYYHDMGKLRQPQYFTENQTGPNPHDDLTPELSTEIIRSHTRDGYELIKKHHLPLFLADVALEHHGTLPIQYFYVKAQKFTDGELDIRDFSYQGPKPHSKIAAIIMIVDGCEAAVRAQRDYSHRRVEEVVRGIIENRMNLDQFSECDLTMREIDIIHKTLVDGFTGAYHDRINYPKINVHQSAFEKAPAEEQPAPAAPSVEEESQAPAKAEQEKPKAKSAPAKRAPTPENQTMRPARTRRKKND